MANTSSQPVKEVPGFARVGEAVRKGALRLLNPVFGTPENPTKLGKLMAFAEEASAYGTMAGPATGIIRTVRAPLVVDERFLGGGTVRLPNMQRSASYAFVPRSGFPPAKPEMPKSMFSNAPGDFAFLDDVGRVVIPAETDELIDVYMKNPRTRYIKVKTPSSRTPQTVTLDKVRKMAEGIDKAKARYSVKYDNLRALNDSVNPYWQYWMYERDIASLNKSLAEYRAPKVPGTDIPVFYNDKKNLSYDVLSAEAAGAILPNLPGTAYRLSSPGLGAVDFMPNHVSAMSRDRFTRYGSRLYDLYNDGYLPYQSATFIGTEKYVRGKKVRPIMRVTDHHEYVDAPRETGLAHVANKDHPRVYHVGREIPDYRFTPEDPGAVEALYRFRGEPVSTGTGAYSVSIGLQQASKGGDSPHRNFRNFLATDKVPESIFGYPVVQREEDYTPEDIEFFKANPKAAGFYDTGNEGPAEDVPQQAAKAGRTYDTELTADQERRYQAWRATLPKPLQYEGDYDLRGYWADPDTEKEGIVDGQHFTDRYKKPNHPTFSVESKYATGENRNRAGRWDGDRFIPPRGKYPGLTNNPGNVEKHELRTYKTLFEGEDGGGVRPKRFARFTDPVLGLKASATVLARKADELAKAGKPFTIENYAPLYAPPNENDTEGYIENLSRYSGIARDAELDRWDVGGLARLLKAKVRFETSPEASRWFTDEEYEEAAEKLQEGVFD